MARPVQSTIADKIDERLEALELSAREASLKTGKGADLIRNIKRASIAGRYYSPRSDTLQLLANVLQTSPEWLLAPPTDEHAAPQQRKPEPKLLGARDLQVFSSVEGGPGEMTVFSTDPYEIVQRPWYVERDPEAFGVFLTGDSMEPVYTAGEIIVASPRAPLIKGKGFIAMAEPIGGDFRASLKLYRGLTDKLWLAKQFNPEKDIEFDRNIWRKAYRVLGSFDG